MPAADHRHECCLLEVEKELERKKDEMSVSCSVSFVECLEQASEICPSC